ncbi:hypothetical protein SBRY_40479 [Actinacidiphila bryophytorum]|uniref:Uncharacterized protein n=1 Tax=Actinacidiphila bryophytorum TaxID=1436133 RepID=A0A9W4H358_9ACTN|nr:hypothetical protein SBRY_40479 [Actinacidiphila bryophytorum]
MLPPGRTGGRPGVVDFPGDRLRRPAGLLRSRRPPRQRTGRRTRRVDRGRPRRAAGAGREAGVQRDRLRRRPRAGRHRHLHAHPAAALRRAPLRGHRVAARPAGTGHARGRGGSAARRRVHLDRGDGGLGAAAHPAPVRLGRGGRGTGRAAAGRVGLRLGLAGQGGGPGPGQGLPRPGRRHRRGRGHRGRGPAAHPPARPRSEHRPGPGLADPDRPAPRRPDRGGRPGPAGRPGVRLGRVLEVAPSAHRAGPAASGACDRKAEGRPRSGPTRTTPTTQRACVPDAAGQAGLPQHGLGPSRSRRRTRQRPGPLRRRIASRWAGALVVASTLPVALGYRGRTAEGA